MLKVEAGDDFVAETLLIISLSAIFLATLITVLCILCWNKIKVNVFRFRSVWKEIEIGDYFAPMLLSNYIVTDKLASY